MKKDGSDYFEFAATISDYDGNPVSTQESGFALRNARIISGYPHNFRITENGAIDSVDTAWLGGYELSPDRMTDAGDGNVYGFIPCACGARATVGKIDFDNKELIVQKFSFPFRIVENRLVMTDTYLFGNERGTGDKKGSIYRIEKDLGAYKTIFSFTIDSLGFRPYGEMVIDEEGIIYGTARIGGRYGYGVIFKISQSGLGYSVLHHFRNFDGKNPIGPLVLDQQGVLYGTTQSGGAKGKGVIFKIRRDGSGYTKLLDRNTVGGGGSAIDVDNDYVYSINYTGIFRINKDGSGLYYYNRPSSTVRVVKQDIIPNTYVSSIQDQEVLTTVPEYIDSHSLKGASRYFLELSTEANFSSPQVYSSTSPSFYVPGLQPNTGYYPRTRTSLFPQYGRVIFFTTGALVTSAARLEVFPNPSYSKFNLRLQDDSEIISVQISDMQGATESIDKMTLPKGFGEALKPGIYVVRVQTTKGVKIQRVMKK